MNFFIAESTDTWNWLRPVMIVSLGLTLNAVAGVMWKRFRQNRETIAAWLMLIGVIGFLLTMAVGMRIIFRTLSSENLFLSALAIVSGSCLLLGMILYQRTRRAKPPG